MQHGPAIAQQRIELEIIYKGEKMKKILSILALFAAVTSFSAPAFADNGEETNLFAASRRPPDWNDANPPEWDRFGGTVCQARNILGQSFNARGNWRAPQRTVANRAMNQCRQRSLPFIARTCQLVGCRQVGGNPGHGRDMIRVRSAIYGANCNGRGGNVSNEVSRSCDGKANCAYMIDVARLGDPAYGCEKDFRVQYDCDGRQKEAYVAPEANGKTVQLRCGN